MAVEIKESRGFGRVRMRHIPDASGDKLVPFVYDVVTPGTTVQTGGWGGYTDLQQDGYVHVSMPGVHRIASLLKRWILGTHQGSVSVEHLQSYLEEFTFRFNRRTSPGRGPVFCRLLEQAVNTAPIIEPEIAQYSGWRR
jgi:transposase-like protein